MSDNMTFDEYLESRPPNWDEVERHKRRMLAEIEAYKLRELRKAQDVTQVELARRLSVSQNRISRIEHGDIEKSQVDTLRRYAEAIGGELHIEVHIGDQRIKIA
ncbi:MAG TPA: helix-turn-helix transcriptional regulator [Thermomicrobiales bacterium]|nr:helix-turn-helix transcriptional regulator [Thermomicrobiales bacterium]